MRILYRLAGSIIIILIFLFCLSGCKQTTKTKEITLGVAWPFASDTSLFEEGIDMAAEEVNENGGIGKQKLTLLKLDDASETAKGIAVAQSLTENKSVMAVIGHKNSYVSVPASVIYEKAGLVMLSPASTAPELTYDTKNIFRIIPNDDIIAESVAGYLTDQGLKRMILYYSDDSYGKGLADAFENLSVQNGITVVDRFNYYSGLEDLKRLQSKWRAFDYDGIFVAAAMPEGSQFMYDVSQAGINTIFAGGNALDSSELSGIVGAQTPSIVIGSVFDPDSSEKARNFTQNFTNKYGKTPDIYAALGYDSVKILADAFYNIKNHNRGKVADKLKSIGSWTGVCGVHEFSKTGDDVGKIVVLKQLKDGKFSRIER